MKTWRECAEHYLEQWWGQDRRFVEEFSDGEVTCETLRRFFYWYGVARTIPGNVEKLGAEKKYKSFADMLNNYRDSAITRENVPEIIDVEVVKMGTAYGRYPWSATSKAFWMMKQHPVVIYDNYAWRGLQKLRLAPGYKTYRQYFNSWFRFLKQKIQIKV